MAKKKPKRMWIYSPKKPTPPQVPDDIKAEVEARANELVETYLKPTYIKPPPKDRRWNYIIDVFIKWHRSFFYFCSTYACPGPNALSPTFESRFARMEYVGDGKFNLSYMRHTDKWWEVAQGLTADQCIEAIRGGGIFQP
jgi:hypothetical protein